MKKISLLLAAIMLISAVLVSCTTEPVETQSVPTQTAPTTIDMGVPTQEATPTPEATTTPTPTPVSNTIKIEYTCKANSASSKTVTGEGSAEIKGSNHYGAGDKVTITLAEGQKYVFVKASNNVSESLIYAPDGVYTYTIANDFKNYLPSSMFVRVSARYPSEDELKEVKNLAVNPFDVTTKTAKAYPHVYASNNYNQSEFGAHCAIDGFVTNTSHGMYPQQSWGPNKPVKSTDTFVIDFGREVVVNELVLYLRGDFVTTGHSHDSYFSEITVKLSDGTQIKINPEKTRSAQTFDLEGKTTTSITLTGFVCDNTNSDGWAGLAEVKVNGYDVVK